MDTFDFPPDGARARRLNANMHRELALSLAHICDACRGVVRFDESGMARLIYDLLGGANVHPETFADYYDLVAALDANDDVQAARLFHDLESARPVPPGLDVIALGDPALGANTARFMRMMNADAQVDLGFVPPRAEVAAAFQDRLAQGLALLELYLPDLWEEIHAIVRRIVITGSDPHKTLDVDGGSHFQLWGALFLNGEHHPDPLAVAEVLAHESAHSLLFGFCTDEPLVENDDEDLYPSPLRADLRPMDGIYHSVFVSARMHWAMSRLAADPRLPLADRTRAEAAARADLANFQSGRRVIAEHGRLTPLGRRLMEGANSYIDAVA